MYQVDYPRVRAIVRKRYAVWLDAYAEIESRCRQAQHGQVLRIDGQHHLLIMALFARTVSNTAAAMLVAEHGYNVQGKSLLRTALESMFVLAAIAKNSTMAEAYVQSGEREIKRKVNKTRFWSDGLRSTVQSRFASEGFKASSKIAKSTTARSFSIEEMAKVAGLHDWYLTAYSLFSDAVHGNIHDLEQQFIRNEDDGEIEAIRSGAIVDHLEGLYLCACEILLKGLEVMDETFQIDTKDFRGNMMGRLAQAVQAPGT